MAAMGKVGWHSANLRRTDVRLARGSLPIEPLGLKTESHMEARAKVMGHSVHQMLISFPIGLLVTAIIFDALHLATHSPTWSIVAYWMIAAGIIGGLLAAVFGFIDWRGVPVNTRARRVGRLHGIGNVVLVVLFAASWLVRYSGDPAAPSGLAMLLSLAGAALGLWTSWLGGELVDRLGVGVDDGAHVDAPSSLSGRPIER
jgi:uncharacterized membrane protein